MKPGPAAARAIWNTYWDLARRYHRFEVRGLENVERAGPALIVGYHGRGMSHDMAMLMSLLRERGGEEIRAIVHRSMAKLPVFGWFPEGLGFPTGDADELQALFDRGESIMVTPGGSMEGTRSFRERYKVKWGDRRGYLKLALKYKIPIIPTGGTGVDDTYIGLNDGYAWGKRLGLPGNLPFWFAFGVGPWPMCLPLPVKIVCHVGKPIHLEDEGPVDRRDEAALERLHRRVMGAVQSLMDEARRGPDLGPLRGTP